MKSKALDWTNVLFLGISHTLAIVAVVWMIAHFDWRTLLLGFVWLVFSSVSITGGYHRLFSHPTYKASWLLRLFYLCFGAAGVQNSALKWSYDHRIHHAKTDTPEDPYNINNGFMWAHIVWVLYRSDREIEPTKVKDLLSDPLVRFQHKFYVPLVVLFNALIPLSLGFIWGDPIGALLVAGFLRLVLQWHATFSVNSFTHMIGTQPYSTRNSARDSFTAALITLGEGYHNFHHKFQADYRNGIRWYHFDPTKWWVYSLSKVGVTRDLRRTPKERIESAKRAVAAGNG